MRASNLFACHLSSMGSQGPNPTLTALAGEGSQQANAPNFGGGASGGSGVRPPAPTQQSPPVWGQPPPAQSGYQQRPPNRSPYA
jgi:hypothetical protein